jgi:DNA-binding NtrC family response regulator
MDGYTVKVANDGKSALDMFGKERFDIAFLDIKMPFFSGTEVLKAIREMGIYIPVIIITAYATVKNAVECTNMGAVAYLQKPFTADKIRAVLKETLNVQPKNNSLESILNVSKSEMESRRYLEAEKLLKSALVDYSLNPEINKMLYEVSRALNKIQEAEQYRKVYEALR